GHRHSAAIVFLVVFVSFVVKDCSMRRILILFVVCGVLTLNDGAQAPDAMNSVAERYVHLVLALGQHDPDYVDAFYGPAEWKTQAETQKKSLDAIGAEAAELLKKLRVEGTAAPSVESSNSGESGDEMLKLRREYLQKQISALAARVRMLKGEKLKFDVESRALYDAVAPTYSNSHFYHIIRQLDEKMPGNGPLWERYEEWRKPFMIPKE